ncbi:hypothetical protein KFU94_39230 [Chloroflexi bacterium TSY]|nr:hypothetical protein [Chloroflexi bacterium TSY]
MNFEDQNFFPIEKENLIIAVSVDVEGGEMKPDTRVSAPTVAAPLLG